MLMFILIMMFVFGAAFGSFACCQAWRLHYKIKGKKSLGKRSVCLHCKYQLKWYDNVPVISWLMLRGKCRKCGKKIGVAEIVTEVGVGMAFMMIGHAYLVPMVYYWTVMTTQPLLLVIKIATLVILLAMMVVLAVLSVYDAKWGELPTKLLYVVVLMGGVIFGLQIWQVILNGNNVIAAIISTAVGVVILAGTCWAIYKVSHEKLMGGGDWILALAIALAIGDWYLALWAMFLSNLLGDIIMLPSLVQKGNHIIHFGPFLTMGFVIVVWLGNALPALMTTGF